MNEFEQAVLSEFGVYFEIFSQEFKGEIKRVNTVSALTEHAVFTYFLLCNRCIWHTQDLKPCDLKGWRIRFHQLLNKSSQPLLKLLQAGLRFFLLDNKRLLAW